MSRNDLIKGSGQNKPIRTELDKDREPKNINRGTMDPDNTAHQVGQDNMYAQQIQQKNCKKRG